MHLHRMYFLSCYILSYLSVTRNKVEVSKTKRSLFIDCRVVKEENMYGNVISQTGNNPNSIRSYDTELEAHNKLSCNATNESQSTTGNNSQSNLIGSQSPSSRLS